MRFFVTGDDGVLPSIPYLINIHLMRHFTFIVLCLLFAGGLSAQSSAERIARATELYEGERYAAALEELSYVDLDSLTPEYYVAKVVSEFALEEGLTGWTTLNDGVKAFPKNVDLLIMRGQTSLYIPNMAKDGLKDLEKAYRLTDVDTLRRTLLMSIGTGRFRIMDYEGAYESYYEYYLGDTTDIGGLTNLALVMDEIGRGDETLVYLKKALAIDSTIAYIYGNIGYKYQVEGDYEQSFAYYAKLQELEPDDPLGFSNQSYNRMKLGDLEGAIRDADRAVELDPINSFAWKNRGLILLEMKEPNLACESFEQALRLGFTKQWGDEVKKLKKEHCR